MATARHGEGGGGGGGRGGGGCVGSRGCGGNEISSRSCTVLSLEALSREGCASCSEDR